MGLEVDNPSVYEPEVGRKKSYMISISRKNVSFPHFHTVSCRDCPTEHLLLNWVLPRTQQLNVNANYEKEKEEEMEIERVDCCEPLLVLM